jgi:hypothetical protein
VQHLLLCRLDCSSSPQSLSSSQVFVMRWVVAVQTASQACEQRFHTALYSNSLCKACRGMETLQWLAGRQGRAAFPAA